MKTNKICVIICEYNPFHNGHKLLLDKARQLSGCDYIACIMSGDFSQRGEPCILNKYSRATVAIQGGADIVIQMPTAYACSSAEVFCRAGINIANTLKNATHICFGSECGDIDLLSKVADFFIKEPKEYKQLLKENLSKGYSYPTSKQLAIDAMVKNNLLEKDFSKVLEGSNNILAIEYLKAIKQTKSKLSPITIKREGEDFNSKKQSTFASATSIRDTIYKKGVKFVENSIPKETYKEFFALLEKQGPVDINLFDKLRLYSLRTSNIKTLENTFDVGEGIENRLYNISRESKTYDDFINSCKTKRYSTSKINRICLANMLGISKSIVEKVYTYDLPYIKVLAVKKNKILSLLECNTNLIIRNSDIPKLNAHAKDLIQIESNAESIYSLITNNANTLPYINTQAIIVNK